MTAQLLRLYGAQRKLAGLGFYAGRPVAFLEIGDGCEGPCRTLRVTLTSASQSELASLTQAERREVADFLANPPTPPSAA